MTTPSLADASNAHDTVYQFVGSNESSRKFYADSPGTLLRRTITTTWNGGTPASQVTILEDSSTQSETDTTFDSNGLLDSVTEYDWGTGARGNLLRTTTLTYNTSTNYTRRNIIGLLTTKIIKDGSNTIQYRQDIAYDGTFLGNCPTGVPQHDDTGFPCTMNYRGNPTAITTYLSPATPSNPITKNFTYDWFGNLLTAQLNCCQQKTWNYSATTEYSQPDSVVSGTSPTLTNSFTYNIYTGQVATSTDPNSQTTHYSYDFLRRPTQVTRPDSSTITYSYDDVNFTMTTRTPIDASKSAQLITALDKLGRAVTTTTEDGSNNVYSEVSTEYDLAGRAYGASNPYTGSPSYWTTTAFDALGRPTSVTLPDNSSTTYSYATNTVTVTDSTGKQRKAVTDAAGRLTSVYEPDPNNGNSLTVQTLYTYTVLDKLATVTEGQQTRTYNYDALGRLTSALVPETRGVATSFTYDNFDNLTQRTDARGVITTYGYDGLNRLSGISYNVGSTGVPATATIGFTYGTNPSLYNNGRLITMTDGVGSENYTYNNMGEMTQLQKVINTTTYTTSYQYNQAAELTQITYPSGRVVQQSVDPIGRLCEIAPSTTSCGSAASPYATGYGYNAAGLPTGFRYGNGIFASLGFSVDRLQLNCLDYSTTNRNGNCAHDATTKFGLNYWYKTDSTNCPSGTAGNNGEIQCVTDSVDNGRSVSYTYDALARLTNATTTGSAAYPQWGLSWTYDRFGNRLTQSISSGCVAPMTCPTNSVDVNPPTYNQITTAGYGYDANGNMTNDGQNTLTYDAENRAVTSSGSLGSGTYTYDSNGLRVKKVSGSTTTVYIFSGSKVIAEYVNGAAPSSPTREYIYSGATLIAKIESGATQYYHQDRLSARMLTDSNGNKIGEQGHFPYGEGWYAQNTTTKWQFTTYERDAESANDYAMARYDVNRLGRFSSPDPLSGSPGDPQSLDRYPYVTNDPVNLADPSGMIYKEEDLGDMDWYYFVWIITFYLPDGPRIPPPPRVPILNGPLNIPTKTPPPPPGYEDCKKGLEEAKKDFDAVQRALDSWGTIQNAAAAKGIDPAMLAAIGVRESGFQNIWQIGGGQGAGVFQIDLGKNPSVTAQQAFNVPWAANWAANYLSSAMSYLGKKFPNFTSDQLLQATAAGYNFNYKRNISGNPDTIDVGTTLGNYGSNILQLMHCF